MTHNKTNYTQRELTIAQTQRVCQQLSSF